MASPLLALMILVCLTLLPTTLLRVVPSITFMALAPRQSCLLPTGSGLLAYGGVNWSEPLPVMAMHPSTYWKDGQRCEDSKLLLPIPVLMESSVSFGDNSSEVLATDGGHAKNRA